MKKLYQILILTFLGIPTNYALGGGSTSTLPGDLALEIATFEKVGALLKNNDLLLNTRRGSDFFTLVEENKNTLTLENFKGKSVQINKVKNRIDATAGEITLDEESATVNFDIAE